VVGKNIALKQIKNDIVLCNDDDDDDDVRLVFKIHKEMWCCLAVAIPLPS
jgi:hypothetical protein